MTAEKDDKNVRRNGPADDGTCWHVPTESPFRLAGFAWFEQDHVYRRLPVKPGWPLPESVDALANSTAGGQIRFQTNSPKLAVRVRLAALANMNHMPATGQCGFDCYVGPPQQQRYIATTKYDHRETSYECVLFDQSGSDAGRAMRNVTLDFPLYQGVEEVRVGLEAGARIQAPPPYADPRPIVVYGTSITQGGCAARPGMAYTNILSRRLNRPFVNLGFSGSGRGEPEVARTMATIEEPACFVLDYEANAAADPPLEDTLDGFIDILREAHPAVPIVVVSRIRYGMESLNGDVVQDRKKRLKFQLNAVESRRAAGDDRIHFVNGADLLGDDFDECTVDGVHPTDLGFYRIAHAFEPSLVEILTG